MKEQKSFEKWLRQNRIDIAESLYNLGLVYKVNGEYDKAKAFNEKALEIRKKIYFILADAVV